MLRSLFVLLAMACNGPETEPTPADPAEAPSYTERGPFAVGTRQESIVGTDGLALTVQIWYPATFEGDSTVVYDGLLPGDAYAAVPADCAEAHPLLAFSHGSGGVRYQSPFLTEFLASHGYVVVAPDHVGNTFSDPSGDFPELIARRPVDMRDSVDWLFARTEETDSPYAGCVDPAAGYAVAGHSFGGYTALALAGARVNDPSGSGSLVLGDERVWAVVAFAPWDAASITNGTRAIEVPALVLTGALDVTTPLGQVEGLWEPMDVEPRYFGVFPDAGHYNFSPVACLLETGDGCGPDFIDEATFTALVNTATAAFLEGIRGVSGATPQLPLDAPEITWTVP